MKRLLLILFAVLGLWNQSSGQTDPVSSYYMFNQMMFNPGSAGSSGMVCATAMNRQQWVGFEGAPVTTSFHVNAAVNPFKIRSGVGLTIINDKTGFDIDNTISLSYAYIADVGSGRLGIGMSMGVINKSISPSWNIPSGDIFVPPSGDPLIPDSKESFISFDMGLGIHYTAATWYAGASVTHLNEPKIKYTTGTPFIPRQYYATAGYYITLRNPSYELIPSLFAYSDGRVVQFTLSSLVRYNKKVWGGVSYRAGDALVGILGIELYNGVRIGYAYDFPLSDIRKGTSGSHEFIVNYCFDLSLGRSSMRYKSIRFL